MHANKEESRGGYQQVCFAWGDAWLYLLLAVRFCRTGSILCLYHPAAIGSHMWDWGGRSVPWGNHSRSHWGALSRATQQQHSRASSLVLFGANPLSCDFFFSAPQQSGLREATREGRGVSYKEHSGVRAELCLLPCRGHTSPRLHVQLQHQESQGGCGPGAAPCMAVNHGLIAAAHGLWCCFHLKDSHGPHHAPRDAIAQRLCCPAGPSSPFPHPRDRGGEGGKGYGHW